MSTEKDQSAIAEVRDQLSLDYADGEYLTTVGSNLGISRPPFGFSDDMWRALVKIVALQYKQVRTKFEQVLETIFGPKVTVGTVLATASVVGSRTLILVDHSKFPQTGLVTLDEGLPTEETLSYSFIDRYTSTMYLNDLPAFDHAAHSFSNEQPITLPVTAGDTEIHLGSTVFMPTTQCSLVLSRGLPSEEVVEVVSNDISRNVLTVSAVANNHEGQSSNPIRTTVSSAYTASSEFLRLQDTTKFPQSGFLLVGPSSNSYTSEGGTPTTVNVSTPTFTTNRHSSFVLVFDGNITATLAGLTIPVASNSTTTLTLRGTLPDSPAVGDTFRVKARVEYTRNVYETNTLNLRRDIPDLSLGPNVVVELLDTVGSALTASVKSQGVGWDVIQVDPTEVDVYLPIDIRDTNDLRSASYIHPDQGFAGTDFASATLLPVGTTQISPSLPDVPPVGQFVIDPGGPGQEIVGYKRTVVTTKIAAGSTSTVIQVTPGSVPTPSGTVSGREMYFGFGDLQFSRTIVSTDGTMVTVSEPLTNNQLESLVPGFTNVRLFQNNSFEISPTTLEHPAFTQVSYHHVANVLGFQSGDVWADFGTFPGPYVYDLISDAPSSVNTGLTQPLSGPTEVVVSQFLGGTALEVLDASMFPLSPAAPFRAIIGRGTGNRQVLTISDVSLRGRATTTTAAPAVAGDTAVWIISFTGVGTASNIPNARGYRVLLARGTVREQVVWVTNTATAPDRLIVNELTGPINAGDSVELMADVLTVDPLDDNHNGRIRFADRFVATSNSSVGLTTTTTTAASTGDTVISTSGTSNIPNSGNLKIGYAEYRYSVGPGDTINILRLGGITEDVPPGSIVYILRPQPKAELVEVQYVEISVLSTSGFPSSGSILLNYGMNTLSYADRAPGTLVTGSSNLQLTDTSGFPQTYPYSIKIGEGTPTEEIAKVTFNDVGANQLSINGGFHGLRRNHTAGSIVSFVAPKPEKVLYNSTTPTSFRLSTPVMLKSTHSGGEQVLLTRFRSTPTPIGYDFPLRMPVDASFRLMFIIDMIRAAGVKVNIIDQR